MMGIATCFKISCLKKYLRLYALLVENLMYDNYRTTSIYDDFAETNRCLNMEKKGNKTMEQPSYIFSCNT